MLSGFVLGITKPYFLHINHRNLGARDLKDSHDYDVISIFTLYMYVLLCLNQQ